MAKDNDYSRAMDLLMGNVDKPTHDPNFFKEKDAHSEIDTLINLISSTSLGIIALFLSFIVCYSLSYLLLN